MISNRKLLVQAGDDEHMTSGASRHAALSRSPGFCPACVNELNRGSIVVPLLAWEFGDAA
jgi:hypothetical protein